MRRVGGLDDNDDDADILGRLRGMDDGEDIQNL
jgi:hypothetical protein